MGLEANLDSIFAQAIRVAGSQSAFGRIIGKRQSVIYDWLRRGIPLPAEHVLTVEKALGISRYDLRPDIYGPAPGLDAPGPITQCDIEVAQ